MIPPPEVRSLSAKEYADIVLRRIWLVFAGVVIVCGVIAYRDFSSPKIYQSRVKFIFQREIPSVTGREYTIWRSGTPLKEDQLNLLRSKGVADRVIKKMNLREVYHFIRLRDDEHAQWEIRDLAAKLLREIKKIMPYSAMLLCGKSGFAKEFEKLYNKKPNIPI